MPKEGDPGRLVQQGFGVDFGKQPGEERSGEIETTVHASEAPPGLTELDIDIMRYKLGPGDRGIKALLRWFNPNNGVEPVGQVGSESVPRREQSAPAGTKRVRQQQRGAVGLLVKMTKGRRRRSGVRVRSRYINEKLRQNHDKGRR